MYNADIYIENNELIRSIILKTYPPLIQINTPDVINN